MRRADDRALVSLEYFTGVTALAGGMMLVARPDGSLLTGQAVGPRRKPLCRLAGAGNPPRRLGRRGISAHRRMAATKLPHARELSIFAGLGLIAFEVAELAWIGFQPLEAVFGIVGAAVTVLSVRQRSSMPQLPRS